MYFAIKFPQIQLRFAVKFERVIAHLNYLANQIRLQQHESAGGPQVVSQVSAPVFEFEFELQLNLVQKKRKQRAYYKFVQLCERVLDFSLQLELVSFLVERTQLLSYLGPVGGIDAGVERKRLVSLTLICVFLNLF